MELVLRATRADTRLVESLCAPASAGLWARRRLPLTGLVADAHVAAERRSLERAASEAGLPYLIDPLTPLMQDVQDERDPWARLPFAGPARHELGDLRHHRVQDELIERTFDFQREHGATILIPPYFYSAKRGDGWLDLSMELLTRSARYLEAQGIGLPVVPIFAASLVEYGPRAHWADGIDRYLVATDGLNVRFVALSWSTSDAAHAGYAKLAHLLAATHHASTAAHVVGWRQGLYGQALFAAGADGYETGAGQAERYHYPEGASRRRPQPPVPESEQGPRGGSAYVYFASFGRSIKREVARTLLRDQRLRGALVCTEPGCCPDGADSMITAWREHAVWSRARALQTLAEMPPSLPWRLNSVARGAERGASDARLANDLLERLRLPERLPEATFRNLAKVADELRAASSAAGVA